MSDIKSQRWCIYIDILGFSKFWECDKRKALVPLGELMGAIYRIGTKVYPNEGDRLFVHQMGDGFAIVSHFGEPSLERPIAIAIALMRHMATKRTFAAAAIAEGDHADITGCYPQEVRDCLNNGRTVRLGRGLMTLSSVMGTAFIRAYRLTIDAPSGPFLTLSERNHDRVPADLSVWVTESRKGAKLLSIDWIRAGPSLLSDMQAQAGLATPGSDKLVKDMKDYCTQYPDIKEKWGPLLCDLLAINVGTDNSV